MKATLEVDLQPFTVPNFVRAVAPIRASNEQSAESPCYPLSDLDSMTLHRLCQDFRDAVFRKAGKQQPPTAG